MQASNAKSWPKLTVQLHQSSYQDAIDIYVESYQGGRNDYFKWVSEQQGLHRMSRTKRHIKRPNDKVPSES